MPILFLIGGFHLDHLYKWNGQVPRGSAPPAPPVCLDQLLATHNDLMRRPIENDERRGAKHQQPRHQERNSSYSDFLATHPPVFADAIDPLEADSWLCTTESKFGLLHCIKYQTTLYAAHQLRGIAGAWWASYIATLPGAHHVLRGEFCIVFRAHHLSTGLLRSKLKEFLDLEQGNRSVFDYMRQFNTMTPNCTYHVDTDEKKANMYRAGLIIHLQERLVHLSSLPYNELASAAIDQEMMMKAVAEADEKKRKRMMPGSAGSGSSSGAPPKYCMVYTPPGVSCVDHNSSRIGAITHNSNHAIPTSTTTAVATVVVQLCPYSTAAAAYHQATTAVSRQQFSMLQLREERQLRSRMSHAQAKQLTASSGTCGKSAEGPSEGSCTTGGPRQLHHRGGDSHGRRSASVYILPQRTSRYYSVRFRRIA
jgi:hypothetical protein